MNILVGQALAPTGKTAKYSRKEKKKSRFNFPQGAREAAGWDQTLMRRGEEA